MFGAFGTALSLIDTVMTPSQTKASSKADNSGVQFLLPGDDASDSATPQQAIATSAQTSALSPQMLGQVFQSQSQSHGRMGLPVFPQDEETQTGERPSQTSVPGIQIVDDIDTSNSAPGIQIVDDIDTTHSAPGIQIVDDIDTTHAAPGIQIVDDIDTSHSAPGIQIVDGIDDPTSTFSTGGGGGGGQTQTPPWGSGFSNLVAQTYVSQMMRVQTDLPLLKLEG